MANRKHHLDLIDLRLLDRLDTEKRGYQLRKDYDRDFPDDPLPRNLYTRLGRLLDQGFAEVTRTEGEGEKLVRYYKISTSGSIAKRAFIQEVTGMRTNWQGA